MGSAGGGVEVQKYLAGEADWDEVQRPVSSSGVS